VKLSANSVFLGIQMSATTRMNRAMDEQVRVLILNEGDEKSEALFRLKKGLDLINL
jgi:hypothetical protein